VRHLLLVSLLLPGLGCIEERLSLDVQTRVRSDGSCERHVEYRLERVRVGSGLGSGPGSGPEALPSPGPDSLTTRHRFPAGPAWSVRDEKGTDLHLVTLDASLPSPEAIGWDYWRVRSPQGRPARNHVAFGMSSEEGVGAYEYAETFRDPASPLAFARLLASTLSRRDDDFVRAFRKSLADASPTEADVKRAFRERLALPVAREVGRMEGQPASGVWERRRGTRLLHLFDRFFEDLTDALAAASPGAERQAVKTALEAGLKPVETSLERDAEGAEALAWLSDSSPIRFRATLILPAPILRANACIQGDTVTWEFDQDDLHGGGFEMWARAGGR
jgi:hypothetical protein